MTEPRTSTPPRISNDPPSTDIAAAVRQVLGDSLGFLYPAALRVAVRLRIADHLTDGPHTAHHLAELTNAHPGHLNRILRYLATRGVFRQDDTGAFHLTPAAALLRPGVPGSIHSMVLLLTDPMYWLPAGRLEDTVRRGSTVFPEIFGAPLFDHLARDAESAETFNVGIAHLSAVEQGGIADTYQFPAGGTVVDVGGGPGGFLHAVLTRHAGLHGVLFEQESMLEHHQLDDPAIAGRWTVVAGDFFTTAPPDGDFYVLKRVLHDWDDADSLRILKACRAAMPDRATVLVIDAVVPTGNDPHPGKLYDIAMMTNFDGKERTEQEFGELLGAADLKLSRIIPTPGTLSIVEAVPA